MDQDHHENEKVIAVETILQLFQVHLTLVLKKSFIKRLGIARFAISTIANQPISCASSIKNYRLVMRTLFEDTSVRDTFRGNRCASFVAILARRD
jgi:hypothetical protein